MAATRICVACLVAVRVLHIATGTGLASLQRVILRGADGARWLCVHATACAVTPSFDCAVGNTAIVAVQCRRALPRAVCSCEAIRARAAVVARIEVRWANAARGTLPVVSARAYAARDPVASYSGSVTAAVEVRARGPAVRRVRKANGAIFAARKDRIKVRRANLTRRADKVVFAVANTPKWSIVARDEFGPRDGAIEFDRAERKAERESRRIAANSTRFTPFASIPARFAHTAVGRRPLSVACAAAA